MVTNTLLILILTLGAAAYMKMFMELRELKAQIQQSRGATSNNFLRLESTIKESVIENLSNDKTISIVEVNKIISTLSKINLVGR